MSSINKIKPAEKLRELEVIFKNIKQGEKPDRIDIDLALEKTRELYSALLFLKESSQRAGGEEETRQEENDQKGKSPVPADPIVTEGHSNQFFEVENRIPGISDKEKSTEQEDQYMEKSTDPKEADDQYSESESESKEQTESKTDENRKKKIYIVADRYFDSQSHINETLANKRKEKDLTSHMQNKPIKDLRDFIGLNEKFLFIRELFNNNPDEYNKCIDYLNKTSTYEEAMDYLKTGFDWDENNKAAQKLINLVKRKHRKE